jgi:hypothetical protein
MRPSCIDNRVTYVCERCRAQVALFNEIYKDGGGKKGKKGKKKR